MTKTIIEIVIKWLIPFVCGGALTGCIAYIRTIKAHNTALEDGLQCLLRAEIIRSHEKYTSRGHCPVYGREAIERAYKAYHALGGNDVATALYEEVMHLPVE